METIMSRTLSVHKEHEMLLKLEAAGLTDELAQRVIDSKGNGLAAKVVKLIQGGGFEATTGQKRAREIMGRNCFDVGEAIRHFGVNPSKQQLAALSEISFTEATLESCKETHLLVAVFSLSILDVRSKASSKLFYDQSWYNKESFAKDKGDVSWQLVRKTPVANSTSKTWSEQQALLSDKEETPTARVVVYTTIGHFLATGERLFERIYVRCSDVDSHGRRVVVGDFHAFGLHVRRSGDGYRYDALGAVSVRKSLLCPITEMPRRVSGHSLTALSLILSSLRASGRSRPRAPRASYISYYR